MSVDTIYALASGAAPSAIAVIRISGPKTLAILKRMLARFPARGQLLVSDVCHPTSGAPLDKGMGYWTPAPVSYTGEDYGELHVHGGRAVISAVLKALAGERGVRLAKPGEFSLRAFLNGKVDLPSLEGLSDLIEAKTERQRLLGLALATGVLSRRVDHWRANLTSALGLLEAHLDFADEADVSHDSSSFSDVLRHLDYVSEDLRLLITESQSAEIIRDGFLVVLAGGPNVGKSSLLNALARRDVAIVTPVAGTTRDLLEVRLDLSGQEVCLVDTAGFRQTPDVVEMEGQRRAREVCRRADMLLWLIDDQNIQPEDFGVESAGQLIRIRTKADLLQTPFAGDAVSALSGFGLDKLISRISESIERLAPPEEGALLTRERQRIAAGSALHELESVDRAMIELQPEIAAEHFRLALVELECLLGKVGVEDVLDEVFSRFCIGK
jgi:tRNA modification GTPase